MSEETQRLYFYTDEELKEKVYAAAEKTKLSVSAWLRLAALEKLHHEKEEK